MSEQALIPVESINAAQVFTGGGLDDLLERIRAETTSAVPDVSSVAGRKEIASLAYKVARSKTTIDEAGKTLVAEWKRQSAEVDSARKKARDYLDCLKDEVRRPLDEWESEQQRIAQEKADAEERARQEAEAARVAEIERREAEIRAREEAIAKAEREAAEKAAAEQAERDRLAREAQRLAAEKAEHDQAEAVRKAEQRVREEAEAKDRARLAEEARVKTEEDRRAADRERRKMVNNEALCALTDEGIAEDVARKVITLIASGSVPAVSIRY